MKIPFWFTIIEQWVLMEKGEYGVTFPFLAGAIAKKNNQEIDESFVKNLFQEIVSKPVTDYYCEVRWCGNIDEPVVSVKQIEDIHKVSIKSKFICEKSKNATLAFTTDLMSMFHFDCSNSKDCLNKLINMTFEKARDGKFSKNDGVFTSFTVDDIKFIETVSEL